MSCKLFSPCCVCSLALSFNCSACIEGWCEFLDVALQLDYYYAICLWQFVLMCQVSTVEMPLAINLFRSVAPMQIKSVT